MLRIKVNYLTRGGIFGSAGFVNGVFASVRERFGKNRKSGARKLKGVEAGVLWVLRDLQKGVGQPTTPLKKQIPIRQTET